LLKTLAAEIVSTAQADHPQLDASAIRRVLGDFVPAASAAPLLFPLYTRSRSAAA
jgi:hypothetical protein